MIKFVKDLIFGEPVVSVTLISLVLTSWLGAMTQMDQAVPLWLAVAAPASVLIGGFYARKVSSPNNEWVARHSQDPPAP